MTPESQSPQSPQEAPQPTEFDMPEFNNPETGTSGTEAILESLKEQLPDGKFNVERTGGKIEQGWVIAGVHEQHLEDGGTEEIVTILKPGEDEDSSFIKRVRLEDFLSWQEPREEEQQVPSSVEQQVAGMIDELESGGGQELKSEISGNNAELDESEQDIEGSAEAGPPAIDATASQEPETTDDILQRARQRIEEEREKGVEGAELTMAQQEKIKQSDQVSKMMANIRAMAHNRESAEDFSEKDFHDIEVVADLAYRNLISILDDLDDSAVLGLDDELRKALTDVTNASPIEGNEVAKKIENEEDVQKLRTAIASAQRNINVRRYGNMELKDRALWELNGATGAQRAFSGLYREVLSKEVKLKSHVTGEGMYTRNNLAAMEDALRQVGARVNTRYRHRVGAV